MDGFDSDDEVSENYYYDILMRVKEPEEILSLLRKGPTMQAWRQSKLKTDRLSMEEMDSLLDTDIVDWHDFHYEYAESICNRRATSKSQLNDRGHDLIDDFERLSDKLQSNHPCFFAGADRHKINQWQSKICVLADHYREKFDFFLYHGMQADLPTRVRDILASDWKPDDKSHEETMYYIAGAVMRMIDNMEGRSKPIYAAVFKDLILNATTTKSEAKTQSLPSGKVEAKEIHGLMYANKHFYQFVNKIESVFHTLLSEENVALYGPRIVADMAHALSNEDLGIDKLLTKQHQPEAVKEAIRRVIWSFGRLRGKDFVRKSNAKMGTKYYETLRATLNILSSIEAKHKENGANPEEDNPRWKYLLRQPKKDLRQMCINRRLPYSGTKKVLARRIIEEEVKQAEARKEAAAATATASTPGQSNNNSNTTTGTYQSTNITTFIDEEEEAYLQEILDERESETQYLIEQFQEYESSK